MSEFVFNLSCCSWVGFSQGVYHYLYLCADLDRVSDSSLKNHKNIGFLSNTGPDPLINHKATNAAFNIGLSSVDSETPFNWRFAGGPKMALL